MTYLRLHEHPIPVSIKPAAVRLLQKTDLLSRFNVICPVQSPCEKYSYFRAPQISSRNRVISSPTRGVSRSSRTLGWDAVDAAALARKGIAGQAQACERSGRARRTALIRLR